jgi:hypothetical protein
VVNLEDASAIGARARMIRRRRGLSLEVMAGLAEISAPYLSILERGQRGKESEVTDGSWSTEVAGSLMCSCAVWRSNEMDGPSLLARGRRWTEDLVTRGLSHRSFMPTLFSASFSYSLLSRFSFHCWL